MAFVRQMQLRLVYSLLKPAVRAAARFNIPIRTVSELVRLSMYEALAREGVPLPEIAARFGQTPRHMRSLAKRMSTDFFESEKDIGVVRAVEEAVALVHPTKAQLSKQLRGWEPDDVQRAVEILLAEGRIGIDDSRRYTTSAKYNVLTSEQFKHRIDALNHHLDGLYRAVLHRLVFDDRITAMIKTITFSAAPEKLRAFLDRLEGTIRREVAELEEAATFEGAADQRFTFGLMLAPATEPDGAK